jgi:flagellar basal-body rod protein FlgB
MSDKFLFDSVYDTLQTALNGLALRQQVVSRNLANVDTPGYQAQTVTFENALQSAQKTTTAQSLPAVQLTVTKPAHMLGVVTPPREPVGVELRQGGSKRADGNNVDVDVELTQMAETGIRYQALTQLITKKYQGLRTIIQGR